MNKKAFFFIRIQQLHCWLLQSMKRLMQCSSVTLTRCSLDGKIFSLNLSESQTNSKKQQYNLQISSCLLRRTNVKNGTQFKSKIKSLRIICSWFNRTPFSFQPVLEEVFFTSLKNDIKFQTNLFNSIISRN